MNVREKFKLRSRPARTVTLPDGEAVHVRDLTVGQLQRIEERAAEVPDGVERQVRYCLLLAAYALVEADGTGWYPQVATAGSLAEELAEVSDLFTFADLKAIAEGVVPQLAAAKNG